MTTSDSLNLEGYDNIITHNDFDGIVSASLCSWILKVQKVMEDSSLNYLKLFQFKFVIFFLNLSYFLARKYLPFVSGNIFNQGLCQN